MADLSLKQEFKKSIQLITTKKLFWLSLIGIKIISVDNNTHSNTSLPLVGRWLFDKILRWVVNVIFYVFIFFGYHIARWKHLINADDLTAVRRKQVQWKALQLQRRLPCARTCCWFAVNVTTSNVHVFRALCYLNILYP